MKLKDNEVIIYVENGCVTDVTAGSWLEVTVIDFDHNTRHKLHVEPTGSL